VSCAFFVWISARDDALGNIADGGIYLLMSDVLSPWYRAPHALGWSLFRDFSFPPLYPLLLGLMGGGSERLAQSYFATALMHSAMTVALYAWFCSVMANRVEAMTLTIIFSLLPASLLLAMAIQSEPLYFALTYYGLALVAAHRQTSHGRLLAAGLFGFSVLARTVGVTLLAAAILHWWRKRRESSLRVLLCVLLILPACWSLLRLFVGAESSYLDSLKPASGGALPRQLWGYLQVNLTSFPIALAALFDNHPSRATQVLVASLALLAAVGWCLRLRHLKLDALFALCYLAVILLWPFPAHLQRFVLVLMPLVFVYAYGALRYFAALSERTELDAIARVVYLSALALLVVPHGWRIIAEVHAAQGSELAPYVRSPQWYAYDSPVQALEHMRSVAAMLESMRGIDEQLPGNACVSSAVPAYVLFYGRREARALAPSWADHATLLSQLEACPYVFMLAATQWPESGYPPMYPYESIKHRLDVIEVKLWQRDAERGTVMTMLARLRTRSEGDISVE
jgi:hypothetical protein